MVNSTSHFARLGFLILMILGVAGCLVGNDDEDDGQEGPFVLTGATLIDGTGAPPLANAAVVVENGRITGVGPAGSVATPDGATILDLQGRWLLPGFVDVHTHMPGRDLQAEVLATLLAFGVTTARTPAASDPVAGTGLRDRIAEGRVLGPRLLAAEWLINAAGTGFGAEVETEADMRAVVGSQIDDGVDFVKLYAGLTPDLVAAGIDAARARGTPVIGHLGRTTWGEAAALGIDHLTHSAVWGLARSIVPEAHRETFLNFYLPNPIFSSGLFDRWAEVVDFDDPVFTGLTDALRAGGVTLDPNLVLAEAVFWGDDSAALARLEPAFAPDEQADQWAVPHPYSAAWAPEHRASARAAFPLMLEAIRRFHEGGVVLTVGTDLQNPWMTPGVTFHRELELLVQAGIPEADALQIATRNGARALGLLDETGTVEVGKAADLVVLTADPLRAIRNTRSIAQVMVRGRLFDRDALLDR